jgi:hypothetical protein
MPKSFVDAEVRFNATFSVLEEYLSGVGSSTADLEGYFKVHHAMFDTACFTVAEYSSSSDAEAAIAQVHAGTPFATVVAQVPGAGPQGCEILYGISSELPTANLLKLPLNTVSAPISADGSYLVLEITSRTPTPFETAESEVQSAVQNAGADKARVVINSAERSAAVSVDPRYGTWKRDQSRIFVPAVPPALDVLNAVVNSPATATSTPTPGEAANPASGQSG